MLKIIAGTAFITAITGIVGFAFFNDVADYREIAKSNYATPWYDSRWYVQPYTNWKLMSGEKREYWTTNYIKTERWFVREVKIDSKEYWTVLKKEAI